MTTVTPAAIESTIRQNHGPLLATNLVHIFDSYNSGFDAIAVDPQKTGDRAILYVPMAGAFALEVRGEDGDEITGVVFKDSMHWVCVLSMIESIVDIYAVTN